MKTRTEGPLSRMAVSAVSVKALPEKKIPAMQFSAEPKNTDKNADPGQEREFMESVCRVLAKYQKNPEANPAGGPLPERAQISHGMSRKRLFCVENNGKITAADNGSE